MPPLVVEFEKNTLSSGVIYPCDRGLAGQGARFHASLTALAKHTFAGCILHMECRDSGASLTAGFCETRKENIYMSCW